MSRIIGQFRGVVGGHGGPFWALAETFPRHRSCHRLRLQPLQAHQVVDRRGELAGPDLDLGTRAGTARDARGAGGGGAAVGRLGVAALPRFLSDTDALPGAAAGNSFRPTASRTCRQ